MTALRPSFVTTTSSPDTRFGPAFATAIDEASLRVPTGSGPAQYHAAEVAFEDTRATDWSWTVARWAGGR